MPFLNNGNIRLHYQVVGSGPPLLLHHGIMSSLDSWRQCGYLAKLQEDFQCILLDARGHGASDKPHDPSAYRMPCFVGDVLALLDALRLEAVDYWGYSMGGWIAYGLAQFAPERLRSVVIGGAHAFADLQQVSLPVFADIDADKFVELMENVIGEKITREWRQAMLANDLAAIAAAIQERPSLEAVLATMRMPCLIYAGELDRRFADTQACAGRIAHAQFLTIPQANHVQCMLRSRLVLPKVMEFLLTQRS